MSGFEKQTYTQVPNSLFLVMKDMDECELKVVMFICRETFGYHREEKKISTRKIAEAIGMSVASVDKGGDAAVARGLIERITDGQKTTVWRAIVSDSDSSTDVIQDLNQGDLDSDPQVRVKERIKKPVKEKVKEAATPKPETPAEVKLYREVTKKYPNSVNFEDVVKAVQAGGKRLLRPVVAEDLKPFYKEWTGRGYNQFSIKWLEWFEAGSIPSKGKPQSNALPRGVQVAQSWLLRKQQEQNG